VKRVHAPKVAAMVRTTVRSAERRGMLVDDQVRHPCKKRACGRPSPAIIGSASRARADGDRAVRRCRGLATSDVLPDLFEALPCACFLDADPLRRRSGVALL
jgi:hypothetical protein